MTANNVLERQLFSEGMNIFQEGDKGTFAYFVEEGVIDIVKTIDGNQTTLGTIHKNEIFGEMALIDDNPRMATAIARKKSTCYIISRNVFQNKLNQADPLIRALLRIFVENIRRLSA